MAPDSGNRTTQASRDDLDLVEAYVRRNSRETVIWTSVKPAPVTRAEALRALGRLRTAG